MKIVFIFPHIGIYRHVDSVVRQLCQQGHTVKLLFGILSKAKPGITDRPVQACLDDFPSCTSGWLVVRQGFWARILYTTRQLINYRLYLNPQHPNPPIRIRWKPHFSNWVWRIISSRLGEKLLASQAVLSFLKNVEKLAPPDGGVALELLDQKADVVVDVTNLLFNAADLEYQKAAVALKIPLVVAIASWDNLTTKGTFHSQPDLVFVWNRGLVNEVIELHHVSPERVLVTGAPTFDYLFATRPTLDRHVFYAQVGLHPARDYVLYLCSSRQVAGDETSFLRDFAASLQCSQATRETIIMVRPYPMNADIWTDFKADNVIIWPPEGDVPDVSSAQQDYFNSMFYSRAIVGVNTTAMIEAAIVDKPCVTILTERYQATQAGRGHFHHLLKADFLEIANDFPQSADVIARILAGEDAMADNRRRFVNQFIRPWGMQQPVSKVFARAVELAAGRKNATEIEVEILNGGLKRP